ncbi:MAG: hypothetical protein Kow0077_13950 [Anaerolineae bacterium]
MAGFLTRIFISYRRADSAGHAGRLYDHLVQRYFPGQVFMDVVNIAPGADFLEAIHTELAAYSVAVVVIGPRWATITDDQGRKRLHQPHDVVRGEVAVALQRRAAGEMRVFPVLVGGAKMPRAADLPPELQPLTALDAVEVTHERFDYDMQQLIDAIGGAFGTVIVTPKPTAWSRYQDKQRAQMREMGWKPLTNVTDNIVIRLNGQARGVGGVAVVQAGVYEMEVWKPGMDASEPVSFRIRGGETVRFHYTLEDRPPGLPRKLRLLRVEVP